MAQLDGLRAFAVMAVVIHHYTPGGWDYGADSGVKLFFTLSGFVITGIRLLLPFPGISWKTHQ